MISVYAMIMSRCDYITIIRDYFYDYFSDSDYFAIILRLCAIIFSIIYDNFTASAPGKWEYASADSNS